MFQSLDDNHMVIHELLKITPLDLKQGPYLTGSIAAKQYQLRYGTVAYVPADIDLVTRTPEQTQHVIDNLVAQGAVLEYHEVGTTPLPAGTDSEFRVFNYRVNGTLFQILEHGITVEQRLDWVDFTCGAVATDGVDFAGGPGALDDLEHWRLHIRLDRLYTLMTRPNAVWHKKYKYTKYTNRGFQDPAGQERIKLYSWLAEFQKTVKN